MAGAVCRANSPKTDGSIGTSRHPKGDKPKAFASASQQARTAARLAGLVGMNIMPRPLAALASGQTDLR